MMRVLLAIVTTDTCTLGFAVSMMRLQVALGTAPALHATIECVPDLHAAIQMAHKGGFDAVAAIRSHMGFPAGFVLRGLVAGPFVAGVYPLPCIDWDRVVAKQDDPSEEMQFKGNVYSVDAAKATRPKKAPPGYLAVREAELGAVVLAKEAIEQLKEVARVPDAEVCGAWGKDILVDLDNQCTNFGPVEFTGCVGLRSVLR